MHELRLYWKLQATHLRNLQGTVLDWGGDGRSPGRSGVFEHSSPGMMEQHSIPGLHQNTGSHAGSYHGLNRLNGKGQATVE